MSRPLYFEDLLATLRSATPHVSRDFEQNLYFQLENSKRKLFTLFDLLPRNPKEKQEIEKGTARLHGQNVSSHFNDGFKNEVLFLAKELDCSEVFCAELIDDAAVMDKFGRRATAETGVLRLHDERASLLECIRSILELAMNPAGISSGMAVMLEKFAMEIMTTSIDLGPSKGKGRLGEKMLVEVDRLKAAMENLNVSLLNAPSASSLASFGDGILRQRLHRMRLERQQLGQIIFIISATRQNDRSSLVRMVRWLSTVDAEDELLYHILTAVFTTLDTSSELETLPAATALLNDREVMVQMHSALEQLTWKIPRLKAAVSLQWSLWVLEARTQDPHIQGNLRGIAEDVEKIVESGIRADGFQFLTQLILHSRRGGDDVEEVLGDLGVSGFAVGEDVMDLEFQPYFVQQVDLLLQQLIIQMSSVLRRIRTKEDDAESAAARHLRLSMATAADPPRRSDIAALFGLMAVVFAELGPESGIKYWRDDYDGSLNAFLLWASESKRSDVTAALYAMLGSLARGPESALEAFNFLLRGGHPSQTQYHGSCSWNVLFVALHNLSENLSKAKTTPINMSRAFNNASPVPHPEAILPDEVRLYRSFLRLLRNVVRFSPPAREAIRDQQDFNALQTLFTITSFAVPLELKEALYRTLAAFCSPGGASSTSDTSRTMWNLLDRSRIVPTSTSLGLGGGALVELEQIETPARQYPATTALVELLETLISTSWRSSPSQSADIEVFTSPEGAVQGRRSILMGPYIEFVVNSVLLRAGSRGYISSTARFRLLNGCVQFINSCLQSYDLSILRTVDPSGSTLQQPAVMESVRSLYTHPGFEIMCRLLANESPLREELFLYINEGYDAIEKDLAKTAYFNSAVRGVLQIFLRVLELQNLFLDVLLRGVPLVSATIPLEVPRTTAPLEQYMIWSPTIVPQIAMYVNRMEDQEMMLLSIDILSTISELPIFNVVDSTLPGSARRMNRLVVILDRHEQTSSIIEGFVRILSAGPSLSPRLDDDRLGFEDEPISAAIDLTESLRSAIMRLLLRNTAPGHAAPNIAHLLLGFPIRSSQADMVIPDPESLGSRQSCLHSVLELLNYGVPRLEPSGVELLDDDHGIFGDQRTVLFDRLPVFAEECYRLIYQLAVHSYTSASTLRYLRTREDFVTRHLFILPTRAPPEPTPNGGYALYSDHSRIYSPFSSLTSFLRLRACLLECVALELHALHESKQLQKLSRLLELLFKASARLVPTSFGSAARDTAVYGAQVAQPLFQMLDIFESLDVTWVNAVEITDMELQFYDGNTFFSCLDVDEHGCEVFSLDLVRAVIGRMRKQIHKQTGGLSDGQIKRFKEETRFVLEKRLKENQTRRLEHAKQISLIAWRHVLDLTLHESINTLAPTWKEHIIMDMLEAIPDFLSRSSVSPFAAVSLAELILSLSTKLRQDRHSSAALPDKSAYSILPADRVQVIFRSIVQCHLRSPASERFRGNTYAALTNFIQLGVTTDVNDRTDSKALNRTAKAGKDFAFLGDVSQNELNFRSSRKAASLSIAPPPGMQASILEVVNGSVDRFIPAVCRDAADGSEIWKTVAFTFLDALVQISRLERAHRVLNVISREGFLKTFLKSLKTSDEDLSSVLKPDPDNLNPLYIYEAMMTLLIRIAQTRQGAEQLLDSRVFAVLTQCEFIDVRPQNDHAFIDFDSFLPSAIERYHQIIVPVLQLAISVVSALGQTVVVLKQALSFVMAHRATLVSLLSSVEQSEYVSLSNLKEMQLLVSLCALILPVAEDVLNPSGFGGIHTAILKLAARCISSTKFSARIIPRSDSEAQDSQNPVQGFGKKEGESVFDEKVETAFSDLQRWLVIYCTNVTEIKGTFKPVLAPIITMAGDTDSAFNLRQSLPTFTDAIIALRQALQQFEMSQAQTLSIADKLDHPEKLNADEVAEILDASRFVLQDLDSGGKQLVALQTLNDAWARCQGTTVVTLLWLETLLLLIWRHCEYFSSSSTASTTPGSSQFQRQSSKFDQLRPAARNELSPILEALDGISVTAEVFGREHTTRTAYLGLISRRLKGILTPNDDDITLY